MIGEADRIIHQGGGLIPLPIVVRLPYGGGRYIAHHREFEGAYVMNSPGLTIVCPSTAQDFYDLFWAAVASEKPVLFFEDKNLLRSPKAKGELRRVPPTKLLEKFGIRIAREGRDVTITAYGELVYYALEAAESLAREGIEIEILDIRVFAPLDTETLVTSVKKTGRLAVVQEEPVFGGTGAEIGATVFESEAFLNGLQAPLRRIGPPRTHYPPPLFWKHYKPQPERIVREIKELLSI